jgi:hypothetical protein
MAVQLLSQSTLAKSASSLPFSFRYFRSQSSPASAWLRPSAVLLFSRWPSECLDVMSNFDGVSAPMKIMQPFDLSERVYGARVFAVIDCHYSIRISRQKQMQNVSRTVVQGTSPMLKNLSYPRMTIRCLYPFRPSTSPSSGFVVNRPRTREGKGLGTS